MYRLDTFDLVINIWAFVYVDNQLLTGCHVNINHCYVDFQIVSNVSVLTMSVSFPLLSHLFTLYMLPLQHWDMRSYWLTVHNTWNV